LILDGTKSVETRTYPIPDEYIGKEMVIIETPGKSAAFKARLIGFVVFGESFEYRSKKEFYQDEKRHCVSPESPWRWQTGTPKWGWPIQSIRRLSKELPAPPRRGIKFTKLIKLPSD
jgi:hypothetical protein